MPPFLRVNYRTLWREAMRGKSIWRILMNEAMKQWREEVMGLVLDCACGSNPSYRRILGLTRNEQVRLIGIDYNPALSPEIVADLTRSIPVKDSVADVIIVSGFLMLIPNPQEFLKEVRRVLKPNGRLLLTSVLIAPYSPDPTDYMRFTAEGLCLLLRNAGFTDFEIVPVGNYFSAAAFLLNSFLRPRWIVAPIVYLFCLLIDQIITYLKLRPCPIGYVVLAKSR